MENITAGEAPVIKFDAEALAPVAMFMAKQDIRYYLNGICVQPAPHGAPGCVIVATDGCRMAMWHDPYGECSRLAVLNVSPMLVAASKKRNKTSGGRTVELHEGRLVLIGQEEGELFIQAGKAEIEDCKYPDVWRVVPPAEKLVPGLHGYMQPRYMREICDVAKLLNSRHKSRGFAYTYASPSHYSHGTEGNGSIVTRFDNVENYMVLTMPVRGDQPWPSKSPLPPIFKRREPETAEKATASYPTGSMGEQVEG